MRNHFLQQKNVHFFKVDYWEIYINGAVYLIHKHKVNVEVGERLFY